MAQKCIAQMQGIQEPSRWRLPAGNMNRVEVSLGRVSVARFKGDIE